MANGERPLRRDAELNRRKILATAAHLFARDGLDVTLNEVARAAGVGVGTVYRNFDEKDQLIEALFEERLSEIAQLGDEALADPDPWRALTQFLERVLELQLADRALGELILEAPSGHRHVDQIRDLVKPLGDELVARARTAGELRADVGAEDLVVLQLMFSELIRAASDLDPKLWRRYFAIVLQGLRAHPGAPSALPGRPLSPDQLQELRRAQWQHAPKRSG